MNGIENGIEIFGTLVPIIQTAIGGIAVALTSKLFIRGEEQKKLFEKIKSEKFSKIIDTLLENGYISYVEYYEAKNFGSIAEKADKYFNLNIYQVTEDNYKKYDYDWFVKFYRKVGTVSNEAMQDIWAKLLAEEISCPLTYSYKTLEILSILTPKDAKMFENIAKWRIDALTEQFIPGDKEYLDLCEIGFNDIKLLSEYNIITLNPLLSLNVTGKDEYIRVFWSSSNMIEISVEQLSCLGRLSCYFFTFAGKELLRLVAFSKNEALERYANIVLSKANIEYRIRPRITVKVETQIITK